MTTGTTPSVISKDTIHITLGTYVDVFVHTAEDTCNRKVCDETVVPFLDALRGLASISHILLEAALEALGQTTHPRESLSEYAYNYDVKTMHREFHWQMTGLEDGIRNTTNNQACKVSVRATPIRKSVSSKDISFFLKDEISISYLFFCYVVLDFFFRL